MKIEQITGFKTSDGALFETLEQAEQYETLKRLEPDIEIFMRDQGYRDQYLGHGKKLIPAWELWKIKHGKKYGTDAVE